MFTIIKDILYGLVFIVISPIWTPLKGLIKIGVYAQSQSLR